MLIIHIIAMVSTTLGALVKTILLFVNEQKFRKVQAVTKKPILSLVVIGVLAGVYMVVTKFGGIVPPWLIIKLCLFVVGGLMVSFSEKRENKIMLLIGTSLLILVWVQANIKLM